MIVKAKFFSGLFGAFSDVLQRCSKLLQVLLKQPILLKLPDASPRLSMRSDGSNTAHVVKGHTHSHSNNNQWGVRRVWKMNLHPKPML
jgi:hypothetical protein